MQKKLVQSSLALAAATALGLGGAFVAGPAAADAPKTLKVQTEAQMQEAVDTYLAGDDGKLPEEIGQIGFKANTLHIGAVEKTAAVEELAKKYGNVDVQVGPEFASFEAQGKRDLVGGAGYITKAPHGPEGAGGACSTGFAGWDRSGNQVVITAGHCAEELDDDANSLGEAPLWDMELPSSAEAAGSEQSELAGVGAPGSWGKHQFGYVSDADAPPVGSEAEAIDIASINVASGFTTKSEVTTWDDSAIEAEDLSLKTVPVNTIGNPTRGAAVTKSGRTTGVTQGTVAPAEGELDYANVSGHLVHGMKVLPDGEAFSAPGDSGGAVYQGETAVGVISGGNGSFSWVSDLKYSLDQAGIDFQLTKPDDGNDDENADAQADGENADAQADGENADAQADGDEVNANSDENADNNGSSSAEGNDANEDAKGNADGGSAAEGKDSDGADNADGTDDEADSDSDGDEKPEAPKVGDQTVVEGGKITGKAAPNAEVKLTWKPAGANAGSAQAAPAEGTVTVKTDADGNFSAEAPAEAGDYNYTAVVNANGQTSAATQFVVTVEAEEAPAERNLTVDPKEISASDFVKEDKGVQITAEGFEEGEQVSLEVVAGPDNVEGITLEETADADGVVGFSIYGTSASNPEAYLGKYDLEVTGANDTEDEEALTGSFEVVADEDGNGGGDDGDDNGNDDGNGDGGGSDLPRTGA